MRVFVGVSVSEEARSALASISRTCAQMAAGRYVPAKNYHITLLFIGEVVYKQAARMQPLLAGVAEAFPRPALTLGSIGHFGKPDNAILHCGLQSVDNLPQIAHALRQALADFPSDSKPLRPHITLARKVDMRALDRDTLAIPPLGWSPEELLLFESRRDASGLHYIPIIREPFSSSK